ALRMSSGRFKEAEAALADVLVIRKQLAADFPRPEFRADLAGAHLHLGVLLRDQGRVKEAEAEYAEALPIQKQLADAFPNLPDFGQGLAYGHHHLGQLHEQTGRLKEAEAAYRDALNILKKVADEFPLRASSHELMCMIQGFLVEVLVKAG